MALHADDPRLTAYVLGELTDDERAEFERELAASPEAERELAEIRETVALVRRELTAEALPLHGALTGNGAEVDGSSLAEVAAESATSPEWNTHLKWRLTSFAAAAALLVAVGYLTLPRGDLTREQSVALLQLNESLGPGQGQWGYGRNIAITANTVGAASTLSRGDHSATQGTNSNSQFESLSLGTIGVSRNSADSGSLTLAQPPQSLQNATVSTLPTTAGIPIQASQDENFSFYVPPHGASNASASLNSLIPTLSGSGSIQDLEQLDDLGRASNLNGTLATGVDQFSLVGSASVPVDQLRRLARNDVKVRVKLTNPQEQAAYNRFVNEQIPALAATGSIPDLEELWEREKHDYYNTEAYAPIIENPFLAVMQNPLSTFSIDVDTASYSNVRRFLTSGTLPPPGAVRIEEMVNYFPYHYAPPAEGDAAPFAAHLEVAECPWRPEHRLVRVGLKGRQIASENRPASNLVFLLDVSGSMDEPNKLPLVKEGMRMLVNGLRENDRVAIVVYAGASGLVLDSTSGENKETILAAIDELSPGGSTNGASGIQLAYDVAAKYFIKEGTNRVILATDGDFNVGITDESQLVKLIEEQAKTGVFLSVLGFGMGNLKDSTLEQLADRGNGNYAYVDSDREARKVLVDQLSGTLVTIAKDVKIQVEFNPARVAAYRLIGYENRMLAKEDFNDDTKDAGEIGAGHTVTALYEVVLAETPEKKQEGDGVATEEAKQAEPALEREVDELEYLSVARPTDVAIASPNLLTLKLRYKEPEGTESKLLKFPVEDAQRRIGEASTDFQLAASVAAFGMLLRGSQFAGSANMDAIMEWAQPTLSADPDGYRRELVDLMRTARELAKAQQQSQQQQ